MNLADRFAIHHYEWSLLRAKEELQSGFPLSFTQLPGEAGTEGASLSTADGIVPLIDGGVPGTFNLVQQDGTLYNPTLFNLTTAEGFTYTIDQKQGLHSITDPNGNTLTITPNGVIHSSGKSLVFKRLIYTYANELSTCHCYR